MDGTQVGIFEQSNQISFAGFLQDHNSGTLETQISFERSHGPNVGSAICVSTIQ
jgi:hypothetical protein